jgi:hypothetical protein
MIMTHVAQIQGPSRKQFLSLIGAFLGPLLGVQTKFAAQED